MFSKVAFPKRRVPWDKPQTDMALPQGSRPFYFLGLASGAGIPFLLTLGRGAVGLGWSPVQPFEIIGHGSSPGIGLTRK